MNAQHHPAERKWLDANLRHIEGLTGGKLSDDLRLYIEDKLLSILCEALSLTAAADDPAVMSAIRAHAGWSVFHDNPDVPTAMSRAAYQYNDMAERTAEQRLYAI
jgi:hypothetical protein